MSQDKMCDTCHKILSIDAFMLWASGHRASTCRNCRRPLVKKYTDANRDKINADNRARRVARTELIYSYLATHPCVRCGESDIVVLDFDHIGHDKALPVGTMATRGYAEKTILAEVAKCQVLCANCHRRKTATDQQWRRRTFVDTPQPIENKQDNFAESLTG